MTDSTATLWQIEISHFSEKARWALDYKGVEHKRHAPLPGTHIPIAMWLTRGADKTFPVLQLDGRSIGDSTAIVAALEQRFPEPPLYPTEPEPRRRALELEDFFDEELGPHMRLLAFHELIAEPDRFATIAANALPGPLQKRGKGMAGLYARTYASLRFGAGSDTAAERAKAKVLAALDRLDAELDAGGGDYLVGNSFSVADLTAASLFYPLVSPPQGPVSGAGTPAGLERFREPLQDRPGYKWVEEMFRRHRKKTP
jgi:glutathione S-transferase